MGPPQPRDEGWFTRIYTDHYADIVNYGRRRLADADAASELAQEVFVVAWRRRADVPARVLPWLYGVARRVLANRWRAERASPHPVPLAQAPTPSRPGPDHGDALSGLVEVRAALGRLNAADQEILRLIGWEELTVGEAAVALDCSRTAAAVRLHRARRRLLAALAAGPVVGPTSAQVTGPTAEIDNNNPPPRRYGVTGAAHR